VNASDCGQQQRGAVLNRDGLDIPKLREHKKKTGSIKNSGLGVDITNKQLLGLEVDILIPAALENAISMDNADCIKARLIAEFGNGPKTAEADTHLYAKGGSIIPDVLFNAGGVIVSYFEIGAEPEYGLLGTECRVFTVEDAYDGTLSHGVYHGHKQQHIP
jgi:glutamate dehydrogenase/leucine dehydrogenase